MREALADNAPDKLNVLRFRVGITADSVIVRRWGNDLSIGIKGDHDWMTVQAFFTGESAVNANNPLQRIEFDDGTVWNLAKIVELAQAHPDHAPTLNQPFADQALAYNSSITFALPPESFSDVDADDELRYTATLADGGALPSWISFRSDDLSFSGTASSLGSISVKVTATDQTGASVSDVFDIVVSIPNLNITGTPDADYLEGGDGNDTLSGLAGNDTMLAGGGNDMLDGGAGGDTMWGGLGDDTYVVDSASDIVTEKASEGVDTVQTSISYTLTANVENLTLTGSAAINGTGNSLANTLTGNSGANLLDGGTGADTLVGGAGNDSYVVDNVLDVVTEAAGGGTDSVQAKVSYTLGAEVENLTLTGTSAINATGNALANVLTGNSGANVLDGAAGADTMLGGAGNDSYVVDDAFDVVTEAASAGTDLVKAGISYTLGANLENLTLTGTGNLNATGNTVANVLTGNAGDNLLNGGTGTDTMVGGAGNDTYVLDVAADIVTEAVSAGTDTVQIGVTYTLGANVENLTLTGTSAINRTGNTLANVLTGNSANNTLTGAAGNDTLDGGAGVDTLIGGTGNDTYKFGRGYGADTIQENDATAGNTDVLQCLSGIATDQLWFRHVGNNLEVSVIGTSDKATLTNWYLGSQYHVEQFKTSDGKTLLDSKVNALVDAMAAFSPPAAGQTTLPAAYQTALNPVIAANWQ